MIVSDGVNIFQISKTSSPCKPHRFAQKPCLLELLELRGALPAVDRRQELVLVPYMGEYIELKLVIHLFSCRLVISGRFTGSQTSGTYVGTYFRVNV